MESQNHKWVLLAFAAAATLVGYIVYSGLAQVAVLYDLETKVSNIELVVPIASVVVGIIVFGVLFSHQKANQFSHEVVTELSRVTWPTQAEASRATGIVIVMVTICAIILFLLDNLWAKLIEKIL